MFVAGIVAEFNPFHNGHKYLAQQTRKNGATHIVAVMSGASVQRGDCAVFDKYFRADCAVKNGIDLVIELPSPFSCSSGEMFAKSAVGILGALGENVVNRLSFGCEISDVGLLKKAAEASLQLKDSENVRQKLAIGKNYPLAIYESACEIYGKNVGDVLANPNSTLAAEYVKAVYENDFQMDISPILRKSVGHHDTENVGEFASATSIREMILSGDFSSDLLPYNIENTQSYFLENMQNEILYRLSSADRETLLSLPDVSCDLADRIILAMKSVPNSLQEFCQACKTRNFTLARLRRIVMYLMLNVKKDDFVPVPYARVLAFNKRGQDILRESKSSTIPIDTSLKRLEYTSDYAKRVSYIEQNAAKLQYYCYRKPHAFVSDYQRVIKLAD